jgi:hypothetical protein
MKTLSTPALACACRNKPETSLKLSPLPCCLADIYFFGLMVAALLGVLVLLNYIVYKQLVIVSL